jgi:hypothetical protein
LCQGKQPNNNQQNPSSPLECIKLPGWCGFCYSFRYGFFKTQHGYLYKQHPPQQQRVLNRQAWVLD